LLVKLTPRNVNLGNGRFAMFNKERDISLVHDSADGHALALELENLSTMPICHRACPNLETAWSNALKSDPAALAP